MGKTKLLSIIILLLLILIFTGCHNSKIEISSDNRVTTSTNDGISEPKEWSEQVKGSKGELFVEHVKIANENIMIFRHHKFANLPVISTMRALGAEITWVTDNIVNISYKGKIFELNTTENYLRESENIRNYIAVPPGLTHGVCYQTIDGDYFVDSDSLKAFFNALEIKMTIDFDNLVVYIQSAELDSNEHKGT